MDLISRQVAIDEIDEWIKAFRENGHKESAADACLIQDGIIQLPSVQPEQRWIPCGERLPKYGRTVLITNDKGNVSYGRFRGVEFWKDDGDNFWTWKKNTIEHVLAWMPLPEPWKGENDE